jgi:hypothetical protein
MKKLFCFISFYFLFGLGLKAQIVSKTDSVNLWKMTLGVHVFTKQKVGQNYEPVPGLRIYSRPTYDFAMELTRFIKLNTKISSSIGFRLGLMPSNQGVDIAENITRNGYAFDDYNKHSLPYLAFKGLVNFNLWHKDKFSIVQSIGSSFVLVPRGFSNYDIISLSSGVEVPYYRSKGLYNPTNLPFFSALSETSLICTKKGEKKWILSLSFEVAPKDVIASEYIFYSTKGELKGTMTRRYQQIGIHYGWFFTLKKKRKIRLLEEG